MAASDLKSSTQFSPQTTSLSSDEDLQVYCQPCDEEGTRLPAHGYCTNCKEHLCKVCFTVHKKHKLSKHHILLDATSMPKSLQHSTATYLDQPDDLTTPCKKHPKEMMKFYCNDHRQSLCSVCATFEHPVTSCNVNYIPDVSGNIINSKQYKDILKTVNNISDQYQQIVKDVQKMTDKSSSSLKEALANIRKFRQEINQRLDELERQTENEATVIEQENKKHLKVVETTCEDVIKAMKRLSDNIRRLNTSNQADQLFMELKLAEKKMKDIEDKSLQLTSYNNSEVTCKINEGILVMLRTETSLATWIQKRDICVKRSEDNSTCWITGITYLSPDLLVVTDHDNNTVKLLDTSSQSVCDQLQLDYKPWDITTVTSTELAVTLPDKHAIQFVSISSQKIKSKHSVKVHESCYGVSCYQDKLVVSFFYPAKLQILDMKGTVLTIFGENIVHEPRYVACNSSSIYVSDVETRKVTRFNWQGDLIGSYGRMGFPSGLALSDGDTIFVCDKERKS
ncbi:uncharacterized protein LOC132720007 [Ruditapes philippinarum]|uniref:uncharacterized protein LOC132720007 n=1 Tax=Ruditapes philippinarum TaxID=129788 RepID=UPI00295B17E9|nr:uncharacterized protein LOC132720007 [Ruditapes philippinarum]